MMFDSEIIQPQTIETMIDQYNQAREEIDQAYNLLDQARQRLTLAFGKHAYYDPSWYMVPDHRLCTPKQAAEEVKKAVKLDAWRVIIKSLNVHKIASTKRLEVIDKQLDRGEGLPDLTTAAVFDILMTLNQNQAEIYKELVTEVFDYLRPPRSTYKTNTEFELGKKVILTWVVEHNYSGGFRVKYHEENKILAIDKAFHLLDGKGIPDGYRSPLVDAINTARSGQGETTYFKFKGHHNMNLHLEFKRLDLVEKLNRMAGGATLRNGPRRQPAPVPMF